MMFLICSSPLFSCQYSPVCFSETGCYWTQYGKFQANHRAAQRSTYVAVCLCWSFISFLWGNKMSHQKKKRKKKLNTKTKNSTTLHTGLSVPKSTMHIAPTLNKKLILKWYILLIFYWCSVSEHKCSNKLKGYIPRFLIQLFRWLKRRAYNLPNKSQELTVYIKHQNVKLWQMLPCYLKSSINDVIVSLKMSFLLVINPKMENKIIKIWENWPLFVLAL